MIIFVNVVFNLVLSISKTHLIVKLETFPHLRRARAGFGWGRGAVRPPPNISYRLRLPIGTKAHDVFHASMLKPYHGDAKTERTTLPPLPVVMRDGEEEFEVESVVSYRRHRGKPQYLIKWLGWPLSESTWENEKDLTHCDSALKHFHEEAGRRTSVKRGAV